MEIIEQIVIFAAEYLVKLPPLYILVTHSGEGKFITDISLFQVYKSGGTIQGKDLEITAEQIQRELGLGVRA